MVPATHTAKNNNGSLKVFDLTAPEVANRLSHDRIRAQLARMLDSPMFRRSRRMSKFLTYVVEAGLDGRAHELSEYNLAFEVFERGPEFDTRTDPIVRVEASRLRHKIREYYEEDGRTDSIWIGIERPGYRPCIRSRSTAGAATHRNGSGERPAMSAGAASSHASALAVAVLPFSDLSQDDGNRYFCLALTNQIRVRLAATGGVRVTSKRATPPELCGPSGANADLLMNLGAVLEGSVQRSGMQIRVCAELSSATTGMNLWGATYSREVADVFEMQDALADQVVAELKREVFSKLSRESVQQLLGASSQEW